MWLCSHACASIGADDVLERVALQERWRRLGRQRHASRASDACYACGRVEHACAAARVCVCGAACKHSLHIRDSQMCGEAWRRPLCDVHLTEQPRMTRVAVVAARCDGQRAAAWTAHARCCSVPTRSSQKLDKQSGLTWYVYGWMCVQPQTSTYRISPWVACQPAEVLTSSSTNQLITAGRQSRP